MLIVYGGAFNPPTKAHYQIAKYLLEKYQDANLIFLPTSTKYAKADLVSNDHRYQMLEIVSKKLGKRASCSRYELDQEEYKGTYYSLQHFKGCYYVMGADNFNYIEKWINYPNLVIENKFIIVPRLGDDVEAKILSNEILTKYRNNFIVLNDFKKIDLSASLYRKTKEEDILLDEVLEYIKMHNLY